MTVVVDKLKQLVEEIAYNGMASGPLLTAAQAELDVIDTDVTAAQTDITAIQAGTGSVVTSTTAALAAVGNAINTADKVVGKMVWDITLGQPVWADAATAGGTWSLSTGVVAHTPA